MSERLRMLRASAPVLFDLIDRLSNLSERDLAHRRSLLSSVGMREFGNEEWVLAFFTTSVCLNMNAPPGRTCRDLHCEMCGYSSVHRPTHVRDHLCWCCGEPGHGAFFVDSSGEYQCQVTSAVALQMTRQRATAGELLALAKGLRYRQRSMTQLTSREQKILSGESIPENTPEASSSDHPTKEATRAPQAVTQTMSSPRYCSK